MDNNYMNYYNLNNQYGGYMQEQPEKPKKCMARAIVAMVMGIQSTMMAVCGFFCACTMAMLKVEIAYSASHLGYYTYNNFGGFSMKDMLDIYLFVDVTYLIMSIVFMIVSNVQGKKFYALYGEKNSRMVKAGKITSIIGVVGSCIAVVLCMSVVNM